jgi:hypothetical protein
VKAACCVCTVHAQRSTIITSNESEMRNAEMPREAAVTRTIDMKLEVVVIPVSDVDRAKRFYSV